MNNIIQRLTHLGYSLGGANYLYAMYMSRGDLAALACYVRRLESQKGA